MDGRNELRIGNLTVAALTAAVVVFLLALFAYPILPQFAWDDIAAGAGLRPPAGVIGGFVRGIYGLVFDHVPDRESAVFLIRMFGWGSAAGIVLLVFTILNLAHPYSQRLVASPQGTYLVQGCLAATSLLFCCSDVVWASVQALTATGLQLLILFSGIALTLKFIWTKKRRFAVFAIFFFTLLAGETALGYVGVVWVLVMAMRIERGDEETALKNPLARMFFRRMLLIEFVLTITAALYLEFRIFSTEGGVFPEEAELTAFVSTYLGGILETVRDAASWKRWVLAFLVIVAPFFMALRFYRRDFEGDDFIPTYRIALYSFVAILTWTQACGIPSLSFRFWVFDRTTMSPLLVVVLTLMSVTTLLWIALLIGVRFYFDTARDVAEFHYEDERETETGRFVLRMMTAIERGSKPAFILIAAGTLLTAVLLRSELTARKMMTLIDDYLQETVLECKGLDRLVTDGALDAALELKASVQGQPLLAVALTGGHKARDVKLRQRGITAPEDLESLKTVFPNTLRSWIVNESELIKSLGTQLALEVWRSRPVEERPTVCGVVARVNPSVAELRRTKVWGRDFARSIIELYDSSDPASIIDRKLYEAFLFVQFRVARFCQWRAEDAGRQEWGEESRIEQELADKLDALNPSYKAAKQMLTQVMGRRNVTLTPRENLQLCLRNADFHSALPFAELVIAANPEDPEANWAFGMNHFQQRNYAHAEPYLSRCLKARPEDPAVLNNLAIIERELGRLDAAERHAREGLQILPDSPHLHRTLDSILKAKGEK